MKLKLLFFLALLTSSNAVTCIYITCMPSVISATTMTTTNLETDFSDITSKLSDIQQLYYKKGDAIKENNKLYSTNIALKQEYLITLKEITKIQNQIKELK